MVGDRRAPDDFVRWNEEMAARYDPEAYHAHPNPLIRLLERRRVKAVRRLLRRRPPGWVLEVGCGPGDVLLAPEGEGPLGGLDISQRLLARAQRRLPETVPLVRGDAERLPFATGSLAAVVCSELLEHTRLPEQVLGELARVLRPGGLAVISVPEEQQINRLKALVRRLRLGRLAGLSRRQSKVDAEQGAAAREQSTGAESQQGGPVIHGGELPDASEPAPYLMTDRMDEAWHLHAFSLGMLLRLAPAQLVVERTVSVPSRLLPLRRVVAFRRHH